MEVRKVSRRPSGDQYSVCGRYCPEENACTMLVPSGAVVNTLLVVAIWSLPW